MYLPPIDSVRGRCLLSGRCKNTDLPPVWQLVSLPSMRKRCRLIGLVRVHPCVLSASAMTVSLVDNGMSCTVTWVSSNLGRKGLTSLRLTFVPLSSMPLANRFTRSVTVFGYMRHRLPTRYMPWMLSASITCDTPCTHLVKWLVSVVGRLYSVRRIQVLLLGIHVHYLRAFVDLSVQRHALLDRTYLLPGFLIFQLDFAAFLSFFSISESL